MKAQKLAELSLYTAAAMLLSYIESLIPFFTGIPGMKLGLPNLAIVMALYRYGVKEAALVNFVRIMLTAMMFGTLFSFAFSVGGAFVSLLAMVILKKIGLSLLAVSSAGGIFHNIGQLLIATMIVESGAVLSMIPVYLVAGLITGFVIGYIAKKMLKSAVFR